jgi:hypothetical protein
MSNLDLDLAEYGKNELLHQAIDRAVLGGRMRIEAAKDALDMYGNKCVVDEKTLQITLQGLPLDKALEKIIAGRPLWQPLADDPALKARSELEAAALAGNVSAHGALWKQLGDAGYAAWKKAHAATPGKAAAKGDETKPDADKIEAKGFNGPNPWKAESWNVTAQGKLVAAIGETAAAGIAKSAKSFLGATKATKAA